MKAHTLLPVDKLVRIMEKSRRDYGRASDLHERIVLARRIDAAALAVHGDFTARLLCGSLDDSD